MDPTRNRNLIWLALNRSADPRAHELDLAIAWDVAVDQMVAARGAGDLAGAARWEARADTLFLQITGRHPEG